MIKPIHTITSVEIIINDS